MKIKFNTPILNWKLIDELRDITPSTKNEIETKIENKINQYLETILLIIKLINESNSLSNEEFNYILKQVYEIDFNKTDILEILSQTYNKNYTNYQTIKTSMISKNIKKERYEYNSNLENTDYQTIFIVACEKDFLLEDKLYSIKELQNLLDSNQIVIVKETAIKLEEKIENKEEYKQFKIIKTADFLDDESEFYLATINYIKCYICNKKILTRIIKYVEKLEEYINELEYISQSKNYLFEETPSTIVPILNKINYYKRLKEIKLFLEINKQEENIYSKNKLVKKKKI